MINKYEIADALLLSASSQWERAGAVLNGYNRHGEVDEIAILCPDEQRLLELVKQLKVLGLEHFNTVESDLMRRRDKGERFHVRFEFLWHPSRLFRLECMAVLDGRAPLHASRLAQSGGEPCLVHASYKLATTKEYERDLTVLHNYRSLSSRASYQNSYGRFSYWSGAALGGIYLKPRVNLRDSSGPLPLSGEYAAK